ncbi:MAG: carbon storage regulator CsrA [Armatimonadetes bacterium]|nr:carbon storage regulator CsrA [Armatimonadota bacterium]
MLVLTRQAGQEIVIDGGVRIKVLQIQGGQVRLGIEAPREVGVYRREVYDRLIEANQQAATTNPDSLGRVLGSTDENLQRQTPATGSPTGRTR